MAALVAGLLFAGGCSGDSSEEGATADGAAPEAADKAPDEEGGGEAEEDSLQHLEPTPDEDRAVVYTAELVVRAEDPAATADEAAGVVSGVDGFVAEDVRESDSDLASATLTMRIPVDSFHDTLDALSSLGDEEVSRNIAAEDVQEQIVDVDARIESMQASVERTRDLMEQAESIDDIVTLENELTTREADLAALQGKLESLNDAAEYSTLELRVITPEAAAEPDDDLPDGFVGGLAAGWKGFVGLVSFGVMIFGVLLPFLIAFGTPAGALWWWLRRRSARRKAAASPPRPQSAESI
ncbi:MAG: DUF4349 domain-containing protein [Stackebrandtia sp.]